MLKLPKSKPNLYTFIPKPLVKTLVWVLILFLLLLGVGAAYTWYANRNSGGEVESAQVDTSPKPGNNLIKPTPPAPNASIGVAIHSLSTPINPGSDASILIRTTPTATCKITAKYNEVLSTDPGLIEKTADEYGMAEWSWFVESTVPEGKWPVEVYCTVGEKSARVIGDLVVVKPKD